jgi:hypothetical protein
LKNSIAVVVILLVAISAVRSLAYLYAIVPLTEPNISVTAKNCDYSLGNAEYTFTLVNTGASGFAKVSLVVGQFMLVNETHYVPSNNQVNEKITHGSNCYYTSTYYVVVTSQYK